ncbi:RLA class II histocompatibility antigen, DP alpha-1 chain-like [Poeciliopsis prolifica]|uniref:RLA class II histocompatibility antigen, DP alpha-1 chain-like n=1 Tax=Poeciliopsis prolifica TaxID=188132 RepID=UPI002413E8BB|nr:RLA class II histocompatibility antigen, DP alpha-1 chain-like [Poeciliopsis prolifica]
MELQQLLLLCVSAAAERLPSSSSSSSSSSDLLAQPDPSDLFLLPAGQHEDLEVVACSPANEMDMMALDGEHVWHADFNQGKGVVTMPHFLVHPEFTGFYERAVKREKFCKDILKILRLGMKDIPDPLDPPSVLLFSAHHAVLGEKNVLVCHVSGFCPAPVRVSWLKNGQDVTASSSLSVPLPSRTSSFTQISRLDSVLQLGDVYSCSVDHPALRRPLTRTWELQVEAPPGPGAGPAVLCAVGVMVGLLGAAAGAFFMVKGKQLIGPS